VILFLSLAYSPQEYVKKYKTPAEARGFAEVGEVMGEGE
jgi:hypothetical protein